MICSKCSIDKTETDFSSYFHSTQNKLRVRKICKSCFNEQKRNYRESIRNKKIIQPVEDLTPIEPIIDIPPSPDFKKCTVCKEWKHFEQYYFHQKEKGIRFADCIDCHKEKDKIARQKHLIENGGSDRILKYPNQYVDEHQRKQVFEVMIALGYTFNEEYETWVKEGVVSIKDGKPYFHFLKYTGSTNRGRGKKIPQAHKDRIMFYRKKGYSMGKISRITGVSDSAICKILKEYENK